MKKGTKKIKEWWRGFRLAFDPGYPFITEYLPEIWKPSAIEKAILKDKK